MQYQLNVNRSYVHKKVRYVSNSQAEKTSNTGVAEAYAEIIDPVKKELENYIKSLKNDDPAVSFNTRVVIEISSVIKVSMDSLFKMVRNSIAVTNSCFLKQGNA